MCTRTVSKPKITTCNIAFWLKNVKNSDFNIVKLADEL